MLKHRLAVLAALIVSPALAQEGGVEMTGTVQENPPGFVKIEGGKSFVGTSTEVIREYLDGKWGERFKESLTSEHPGKQQRVETFWIQNSEATNRQYHAFVVATGHRPPLHWCEKAIREARKEHQDKQDAMIAADPTYKPQDFDDLTWWEANAKDCEWEVPAGQEDFPVCYVSFRDAEAYCAWAGLRLPTEAEWSRAARGDGRDQYVWGDEWDARKCLNIETSGQKLKVIGSYPASMTSSNLFDLAGSVYEWTTTPFEKLPGFEPLEITIKIGNRKEREKVDVTWRPTWRVIKGGSFLVNDPRFSTRIGHRLPAPPEAYSDQMGFRPARSEQLGFDHITTLIERVIPFSMLGRDGDIDPYGAVGLESWTVQTPGGAPGIAAPGNGDGDALKVEVPVPGYGVIVKHNTKLFAPVKRLPAPTERVLAAQSLKDPVAVGVLSISEPSEALGLKPGIYVVKYRAAGRAAVEADEDKDKDKDKDKEKEEEAKEEKSEAKKDDGEKKLEIDPKKENLLFYEVESRELAAVLTSSKEWLQKASKPKRGEKNVSNLGEYRRNRSAPRYEQFQIFLETPSSNTQFELTFQMDEIK